MLTIRQYLEANPQHSRCSKCSEPLPNVPRDVVACVCSRCTAILAQAWPARNVKPDESRMCPGCGKPKAPAKQRCPECGAKHARALAVMRRQRAR